MEGLVLPNINNKLQKQIATDEMPQSADGKTVMTSQPKFIPATAVKVQLKNKVYANVRLVDCVGYFVDGALGHEEDGKPRMVKTPWSEEEIPFEKAGEIGTNKVITEYSTIGVLVTTDGSIGDLPRESYVKAEERAVAELKELNKPFVIVLNVKNPESKESRLLKGKLEDKYGVTVVLLNVLEMTIDDISAVMEKILFEFPMQSFDVSIPKWLQALPKDNDIIQKLCNTIKTSAEGASKMKDYTVLDKMLEGDCEFCSPELKEVNLAEGSAIFSIKAQDGLFYSVLSKECGDEIRDDSELLSYVKTVSEAKKEYKKLKNALDCAKETGYGIVEPDEEFLQLEEPVLTRQSGRYGVKFKASAPSLHILSVDLSTEVAPIVGGKEQSEELVNKLIQDYQDDPKSILSTNIFGKTLDELIGDGLKHKATNITPDAQGKMRKTVTRIINESKGGVICILL